MTRLFRAIRMPVTMGLPPGRGKAAAGYLQKDAGDSGPKKPAKSTAYLSNGSMTFEKFSIEASPSMTIVPLMKKVGVPSTPKTS